MFEQIMRRTSDERRPWALGLSFLLQCLLVGIMVMVPMICTEVIPSARVQGAMLLPPPPPARGQPDSPPVGTRRPNIGVAQLMTPTQIPPTIDTTREEGSASAMPPGPPLGLPEGVDGGTGDPRITNLLGRGNVAPPPAVKYEPPAPPKVRVGGDVQQARLISQPKPQYPPLARQARISGTVRLAALISQMGTIEELRVLSGHALLVPAALAAVKQWRYRPTFLNGEPVKVETTMDVNFILPP